MTRKPALDIDFPFVLIADALHEVQPNPGTAAATGKVPLEHVLQEGRFHAVAFVAEGEFTVGTVNGNMTGNSVAHGVTHKIRNDDMHECRRSGNRQISCARHSITTPAAGCSLA